VRPRFHVPDVNGAAVRVELPEDEAEHLVRVLRLGVGDEVDVFDGRGGMWRAEIVHAGKKSAAIRPLQPLQPARELAILDVIALPPHDPRRALDVIARRITAKTIRAEQRTRG